jgi:hypothetical protein
MAVVELFELNIDTGQALQDLRDSQVAVDELKKEINNLKKAEGDNSLAIAEKTAQLKVEQKELRTNTGITQNVISANKANTGSISELRSQLIVTSAQWAKLSKDERNNSEEGKRLTKQKTLLTETLKKEEAATGDARRNVGNYSRGIQDAAGSLTSFIPGLGQAGQAVKQLGIAVQVGLGPFTLLIAAVAAIIAGLKAFFTSSEEGQDAFKRLGAIFEVVVGNIVDLLSEFGKALLEPKKAIEDLKNFIDDTIGNIIVGIVQGAFSRIGKAINVLGLQWEKLKNVFTDNAEEISEAQEKIEKSNDAIRRSDERLREGIDNTIAVYDEAKKALGEFITEQEREIAIAQTLADNQALLDKQIRKQLTDEARTRLEIAKLRDEAAKKEEVDATTRLALLEEAQELERSILETNVRIAEEKARIGAEQLKLSNSTKEDLEEQARLEAQVFAVQENAFKQLRRLESERQTAIREIRAEDEAEELAAIETQIAAFEAEVQAEIDKTNRIAEIRQEARDIENEARLVDAENQFILAQDNIFRQLELERQGLELQEQQEIDFAERIGADTTAIEEKFAKARQEINRAEVNAKLALAADFAGNIAQIAGEGTAIGKAAAVAQTTISTFQGAQGAFSALAPIPIVGPALGIAAAGAAVAAGVANVKKILAVKSGLPGDTNPGGGVPSASTPASVPVPRAEGVAPDVNEGIVSRQTQNIGGNNGVVVQPTLVTDDVTVNQNQELANTQTSAI